MDEDGKAKTDEMLAEGLPQARNERLRTLLAMNDGEVVIVDG